MRALCALCCVGYMTRSMASKKRSKRAKRAMCFGEARENCARKIRRVDVSTPWCLGVDVSLQRGLRALVNAKKLFL